MKSPRHIPVIFYEEGTCSLGALITATWTQKPFKVCRLEDDDGKSAEYLTLNGLGQVPLVFEDGVVLTENTAVLHHLAARNATTGIDFLVHSSKWDQLNRALGFLTSDFHRSFAGVFAPEVFHPDAKIQKEIREHVIKGYVRKMVAHAEKHFFDAQSPFLFDHPTIADAYLFAMLRWTERMVDLEKEFPNLKRFQDAMNQDAGVRLALEIESGKLVEERDFFKGALDFQTFGKEAAAAKKARETKPRPGLSRSPPSTRPEPISKSH